MVNLAMAFEKKEDECVRSFSGVVDSQLLDCYFLALIEVWLFIHTIGILADLIFLEAPFEKSCFRCVEMAVYVLDLLETHVWLAAIAN